MLHRGSDADESVAAFVRRHFGEEVVATVAGPLLAGVFGGDIEKLSARALLGPFVTLEAQHGSLIASMQQSSRTSSTPVFTTLGSGLGVLVDRLVERLPAASIRLSAPVLALHPLAAGWAIETASGRESFDRVLIATSLDTTRQLLASLPLLEAKRAAALLPAHAASGLVVALGFKSPGTAHPSNPAGLWFPGCSEPDRMIAACSPAPFSIRSFRAALRRARLYCAPSSRVQQQTACQNIPTSEIAEVARRQLIELLGPLPEHADVTVVRRWPHSLPQYEVGHLARMAEFETCVSALSGIGIAGNALRGVGLPDLIRDATQAAHALARA